MDELEKEFGLLFELLMWFKDKFFHWMDKPSCKDCDSSQSTFHGYSSNPEDFVNTNRVEVTITL